MVSPDKRVLLLALPWRLPRTPGIALATLRPLLERAGIATDELHGSTLFPYSLTERSVLENYSQYLFVPCLYPDTDREELADRVLERYRVAQNIGGIRYPDAQATFDKLRVDAASFRRNLLADMNRAAVCVDRIVERAAAAHYDVVGMSATFEQQLPAAVAIARRLKERRPTIQIALGGATCFEEQGDGLARSFPVFDAVCHTEGEGVIATLVHALRGELPMTEVPGIAYLDPGGQLRRNPSPPIPTDLDALPIPRYDRFLEQLEASDWRHEPQPRLLFETSRGCWWGQKHLCTFCGLNREGLTYRHKSSERTYREIVELYRRYPKATFLQSTDNILPMQYIKEVMPRLARLEQDPGRPLHMFFMVKSNLRRDQLQAIRDGGVAAVQPGIESLHDEILKNMDKGVTGIGQVQMIKWATEVGLTLSYNLIIRNPGDRPQWYREMAELVAFIDHLPPPTGVTPMMLNRFSRYHTFPERYGIANKRPQPHYQDLYRDPDVQVEQIAYEAAYDHPALEDAELVHAQRTFFARVEAWNDSYEPDQVSWLDGGAGIVIRDNRSGALQTHVARGVAADVFRFLDQHRPRPAIERRFGDVGPDVTRCLLDTWLHRRAICFHSDRYLVVLPAHERRGVAQPAARPQLGAAA